MIIFIILLIVSWLAATISGIAGFGGSLIILPAFSFLIGAKKAIPILTIAWMMGNLSRAVFGYKDIQWTPVIYFCIGALPGAILGSMLFVDLPAQLIMKAIGVFLFFILYLRNFNIRYTLPEKWFIPFGALVGFLSSVLGSAGPIGAIGFLSLNFAPTAYVASEAVTAVVMHLTKTIVYGRYALITAEDLRMGIVLGLAMVAGSWTARKFIKQLSGKTFNRFVDILLGLAAISLFIA
ncbi:MAG: sulfite exporter TauE/SafE family protein [Candidatus Omnitrophica bacterium CG12_big_fil_rev_8_21_14_0_65_50_5]|nr:MAG: sulfite exporter TauE/SafE family protein [Candidatus Omnitrophica bacterium CG12_big_fil_rev_8_21_14_0_65_50_5]